MNLSKYQKPRARRYEVLGNTGRTRGGKLEPVAFHAFIGSEGGMIRQDLKFELDPIPGRILTPIRAQVQNVFVPVQAMHELKNPDATLPGNDELIRQELLSGDALFGVEPEHEISRRANVEPVSISGTKYVSETIRLAYICAVNFLRQRKYVKAKLLDTTRMTPAPAILSQTVLEMMNGVLDPEDRVNGAVNLTGKIPISGIGVGVTTNDIRPVVPKSYEQTPDLGINTALDQAFTTEGDRHHVIIEAQPKHNAPEDWFPAIYADLSNNPVDITLQDFYTAERMDALTREARRMIDANPVHGEQMVSRWAHGLSVDMGKQPFVMYEDQITFGDSTIRAMDGDNLDKLQTNSTASWPLTLPVPKTEFGGVVVTLVAILPDETLPSQPHPILSREWVAPNYLADELALDPVPVIMRDINSEADPAEEEQVMMFVGNNHLKKSYVHYGFSREVDPTTVEHKTAIWQLEVPLSVTPDTVNYPENLDHYPFADQLAEVCTYQIDSVATVVTPLIFGPTPVEELAVIEDEDLFGDGPREGGGYNPLPGNSGDFPTQP